MIKLLTLVVCAAALAGGTLTLYAPGVDLGRLNAGLMGFSETSVAFINKALTPVKPEAAPLDPVAAARVNEDLDYHIAAQTKSVQGWRAFLAAHPHGAHAPAAQAELDKLAPPPAPAPAPMQAQAELDKLAPSPAPAPAPMQAPTVAKLNTPRVADLNTPRVAPLNTPSQQLETFRLTERESAEAPEPKTTVAEVPTPRIPKIVKWRERRFVHRRLARSRRRAERSSLPPFLLALFGDLRARGGRR
jgi:hypothetical protein